MAVLKKKQKRAINPNVFLWTPQRKKAALLIAEGTKNYTDIALEIGVNYVTLWEWRQHPIFQAEVSRLTLANEKATREGLLRIAYKAIEEKIGNIADDKNTVLEWSKFIVELQGLSKQKIEVDANIKGELDGARELLASRIAGISTRIRAARLSEESDGQTGPSSEV
jgi:transposase-like protein